MADGLSYSTVPTKLSPLLKKIRETGVPPKATKTWLASVGFKSSNDPSMIAVLRQIGFIDLSGVPTPAWKEYRGQDSKAVLGRAIQSGYPDLYSVYPDAHNRDNAELSHIFTTKTTAGQQVVGKMVSTFKALAAEADFSSGSVYPSSPAAAVPQGHAVSGPTVLTSPASAAGALAVNINVQLTLPEGADEKTYEAFFKAMRTHLLTDPE